MNEITIGSGATTATVAPSDGGRLRDLRIAETDLLVDPTGRDHDPVLWGLYPMVPWAGRIRGARFTFNGQTVQLPRNAGDHAMHGCGHTMAWCVTAHDPHSVHLRLALPTDHRWPFGG